MFSRFHILLFISLVMAGLLLLACHHGDDDDGAGGGDDSQNGGGGQELKPNIGITMADVDGFVITTQGASKAGSSKALKDGSSDQTNELWSMGKDGSVQTVTVTQGEMPPGEQGANPVAVFDTKTYVIFAYDFLTYNKINCNLVPVSKADGSMYCVDAGDSLLPGEVDAQLDAYWQIVEADATGNLVWEDHNEKIVQLDLTDPNHPTQSVQLSGDFGCDQAVNGAGDDLVSCSGPHPNDTFTRVLLKGGGFFNVAAYGTIGSPGVTCLAAGTQANPDDFYYLVHGEVPGNGSTLTS